MLYNTERPMTFDSVVDQKYIVESIRAQAVSRKFFGVYLFGGHFGCGKTSMARILTLAANCEHPDGHGNPCLKCRHCRSVMAGSMDVVEVDAATNTGVDSIRDLRETVRYRPAELDRKIYIIDEVHMLSKGAFNALLKVLEEPPGFVTFILCTTEVQAIPATIRSRAACYFFEQLTMDELVCHVEGVAERNGITLLPDAARTIAKYSEGAARNALSILDQVSSMQKEVSPKMVQQLLGVSDNEGLFLFAGKLLAADTMDAVSLIKGFSSQGKDFSLLCGDLIEIVTDAVLFTIGGRGAVRNTSAYADRVGQLASASCADRLCLLADHLHELKGELRGCPGKSTVLAAAIRFTMDAGNPVTALNGRVAALEKEVSFLKDSGIRMLRGTEGSHDGEAAPPLMEDAKYPELGEGKGGMAGQTGAGGNAGSVPAAYEKDCGIPSGSFDSFDLFSELFGGGEPDAVVPAAGAVDVKGAAMLLERIALEHPIFATAMKGCRVTEQKDGIHIESDMEEIKKLVGFYCSHYGDQGFDVSGIIF